MNISFLNTILWVSKKKNQAVLIMTGFPISLFHGKKTKTMFNLITVAESIAPHTGHFAILSNMTIDISMKVVILYFNLK